MNIKSDCPGLVRRRPVLATLAWLVLLTPARWPAARAGEPARTDEPRKTIIVLGDSLSAGLGLDPGEAFPALLQKKIDAAGWNYAVRTAGVSGDTSADG